MTENKAPSNPFGGLGGLGGGLPKSEVIVEADSPNDVEEGGKIGLELEVDIDGSVELPEVEFPEVEVPEVEVEANIEAEADLELEVDAEVEVEGEVEAEVNADLE